MTSHYALVSILTTITIAHFAVIKHITGVSFAGGDHTGGVMVKKDKQVVTFTSADGTMQLVICMEELDVAHLDEKIATAGTHFIAGWSCRCFVKTEKGVIVIIPE